MGSDSIEVSNERRRAKRNGIINNSVLFNYEFITFHATKIE